MWVIRLMCVADNVELGRVAYATGGMHQRDGKFHALTEAEALRALDMWSRSNTPYYIGWVEEE